MREILFRGKVADEPDEWVQGYLRDAETIFQQTRHEKSKCCDYGFFSVKPETIGQYTGLTDNNGTKIFEGDIVKFNKQVGYIVYEYGSFGVGIEEGINYRRLEKFTNENLDNEFEGTFNDNFIPLFEIYYNLNNVDDYIEEIEVIGNIYDNPELLEDL